jgi:hypothetical protein
VFGRGGKATPLANDGVSKQHAHAAAAAAAASAPCDAASLPLVRQAQQALGLCSSNTKQAVKHVNLSTSDMTFNQQLC